MGLQPQLSGFPPTDRLVSITQNPMILRDMLRDPDPLVCAAGRRLRQLEEQHRY